jgi:potassium-transporting ATPase KdpC subunit
MLVHLRRSILFGLAAIVATFVYAYIGTGVSQVLFKHQADGSITARGSTLIGQNWSQTVCPGHPLGSCVFQGRPDDLGPYANAKKNPTLHPGDDPLVANGAPGESGATNLGPRSQELVNYTEELVAYWHRRGVDPTSDLVTTSGSGYDPDITPQDAIVQIPMVARATGISPVALRHLISQQTQGRQLGFLGSPIITVLQLNEGLARLR